MRASPSTILDRVNTAFAQMVSAAFWSNAKSSAVILTVTDVVLFMCLSSPLGLWLARNLRHLLHLLGYNVRVWEYELFLRLLAARVFTARLASGVPIRDAGDFRDWLDECAEIAAASDTVEQFFDRIR
jgi:hypothetical protein